MLNVNHLIQSGGLILIGLIIFAESGLLVGFFLPGDTLLFPAGFFAAQGQLPLVGLIITVVIAAMLGDNVGYTIGKHAGHHIFRKQNGLLFRRDYIVRAQKFYEKHGGKTIIFARFLPILRTFAPVVAGVGTMPRKRFIVFDAIGAIAWATSVTLLGYWLGSKIPNLDRYLLPAILLAMLLSFGPTIYHVVKEPRVRQALRKKFR